MHDRGIDEAGGLSILAVTLAALQHLLEALPAEPEALGRARLRSAVPECVLDHSLLELLDRLGEGSGPRRALRGPDAIGTDAVGKMLGPDRPAIFGQGHRPLDLVLELADIAGKRVRLEHRHGLRRDRRDRPPGPATGRAEEGLGEDRDVLAALAQRGERDGEHVEPVVEVAPEAPRIDVGLECALWRR